MWDNVHFPPWFSWSNVLLALFVLYVVICLWRWHRDKNDPFDARDFFRDNGLASQPKLIVFGMAVLAAWVVVKKTLADKDVETLLLGVLGIFVLRSAVGKVSDAFASRPAAPPPQAPAIGQQVVNMAEAETAIPIVKQNAQPASAIVVPPPSAPTNRVHE